MNERMNLCRIIYYIVMYRKKHYDGKYGDGEGGKRETKGEREKGGEQKRAVKGRLGKWKGDERGVKRWGEGEKGEK